MRDPPDRHTLAMQRGHGVKARSAPLRPLLLVWRAARFLGAAAERTALRGAELGRLTELAMIRSSTGRSASDAFTTRCQRSAMSTACGARARVPSALTPRVAPHDHDLLRMLLQPDGQRIAVTISRQVDDRRQSRSQMMVP
jgi:hypothetical protein